MFKAFKNAFIQNNEMKKNTLLTLVLFIYNYFMKHYDTVQFVLYL